MSKFLAKCPICVNVDESLQYSFDLYAYLPAEYPRPYSLSKDSDHGNGYNVDCASLAEMAAILNADPDFLALNDGPIQVGNPMDDESENTLYLCLEAGLTAPDAAKEREDRNRFMFNTLPMDDNGREIERNADALERAFISRLIAGVQQ